MRRAQTFNELPVPAGDEVAQLMRQRKKLGFKGRFIARGRFDGRPASFCELAAGDTAEFTGRWVKLHLYGRKPARTHFAL